MCQLCLALAGILLLGIVADVDNRVQIAALRSGDLLADRFVVLIEFGAAIGRPNQHVLDIKIT